MFRQRHGLKAVKHPPEEKALSRRKTTWWLRMSLAVAASFLLLVFTFDLVYSNGMDHISNFAATKFQRTCSTTTQVVPPYPYRAESSITCHSNTTTLVATCPTNYPTIQIKPPNYPQQPTCPEYFRWIHEDLKPWKKQGVTREMIEDIARNKKYWRFRLVIVNGTAYVRTYGKAFLYRDTYTLWGILQLLKRYPGKLPDLDLIFQCEDKTSIKKVDYEEGKAPPLFHYCGSDDSHDIVFPDWSFWGWPDANIKPWISMKKDMEDGNKITKWTDREPYAFWRGNLLMGDRRKILKCNSTKDWNTIIHNQDWKREAREGYKNSDVSKQCKHKYKIYMEGYAWSVSRKYILACDSMTLLINPTYYDFYTRNLVPGKHFWPIDPDNLCESLKFAVDWGNRNPNQAQEIGTSGTKFIQDITMPNVYDYMFHLLSEYGKLLTYKPTVPHGAAELCSDFWVCARSDIDWAFKVETSETGPTMNDPCTLPPPFKESEMEALKNEVAKGFTKAQAWDVNRKTNA